MNRNGLLLPGEAELRRQQIESRITKLQEQREYTKGTGPHPVGHSRDTTALDAEIRALQKMLRRLAA